MPIAIGLAFWFVALQVVSNPVELLATLVGFAVATTVMLLLHRYFG